MIVLLICFERKNIMKIKNAVYAGLVGTLLIASGCSSKKVSQTCTTSMMGITMSATYSAPSETSEVDDIQVTVEIPLSMLELAQIDTSDKQKVEEYIRDTMGSELDGATNIQVQVNDEKAVLTAKADEEVFTNSTDTPTFEEMKKEMEKTGMFACN